jgi:hypothetical protein
MEHKPLFIPEKKSQRRELSKMRIRYNHEKNGIPPSKVTQSQKSDADSSDEENADYEWSNEWDQLYDDIDDLEGKRKSRKSPRNWNDW